MLNSEESKSNNYFLILFVAIMHGSILPVTIPPPGNPRDKSSPSGSRVGNCLKRSCPGGRGAGQIEISCEAPHFSVDTMVLDHVEKTACFQETGWRRIIS